MDDRVWKNISIALGVICALLIGVAGALLVVGHKTPAPTDTSSPTASLIAAGPSSSAASIAPSESGSPSPSQPVATPGAAAAASISFTNLALDSSKDSLGTIRTFTFQSDGAGAVVADVTKISSGGYVKICLSVDGSKPNCLINRPGKTIGFSGAESDPTPNTWTVTLVGYASSHPTVDVTFAWQTSHPQITVTHGRFQGDDGKRTTASDALGGLTATFHPRAVGVVNVQAEWTIATTDAAMTLSDVTSTPALTLDQRTFTGVDQITPVFTANVDSTKTYQVQLVNIGASSTDRPDLTAQISFP